jgi:ribosomal protein S18 acetylase RimI-like enzyme
MDSIFFDRMLIQEAEGRPIRSGSFCARTRGGEKGNRTAPARALKTGAGCAGRGGDAKSLARKLSDREARTMMLSVWVQFTWDLKKLTAEVPKLASSYTVEAASQEDKALLLAAVTRSFSMESAWSDDLTARVKLTEEIINTDFTAGEVSFIAIKHGARIIGASAIRDAGDKVSNLPLGITVLNEYRCRGLGTFLLYESLRRLRERGLDQARVVTKKGVPADRYLYPKFGGARVVLVGAPA